MSPEPRDYLSGLLGVRAQVRHSKRITITALVSEPERDLAIVRRLGWAYRRRHPAPEDVFWLVEYAQTSLSKVLAEKKGSMLTPAFTSIGVVNLRDKTLLVFRQPAK